VCRALTDTGVAGRPDEYFLAGDPDALPGLRFWEDGPVAEEHGGVRSRREYLDLVYRIGTTPNGVFGAKLMWNNVAWAVENFREMDEFGRFRRRADIFHAVFPNLSLIRLLRRDVVRQAVSWARAAQDGVWVVSEVEAPRATGRPEYSYEFISDLVGLVLQGERGWTRLSRELGVTPLTVLYEELVSSDGFEASTRRILRHLQLDDGVTIPPPRTSRQADDLNEEWIARFLAEARARDHPNASLMMRRHQEAARSSDARSG
jgi:LPS sulfotransferase NodH